MARKQWLITFYPEMAAPITVPAVKAGFNETDIDLGTLPIAESASQANDHARAWSLPTDDRNPRVFRGEFAAIGGVQ